MTMEIATDIYKPDMQSSNSTTYPSNVRRCISLLALSMTGTLVTDNGDNENTCQRGSGCLCEERRAFDSVTRWCEDDWPAYEHGRVGTFGKCGTSDSGGDLSWCARGLR